MAMRGDRAVRLPKKAEVVARRIAAMIVDERLEPGTPLPNEPDMLAEFGVARSTLREALRLLETQGVLSLQAGRSPMVRRPTAHDLVNSLTLWLQFQGGTFEDLLRARVLFEPAIAAEAALRRTDDDIARLRKNIEEAKADAEGEWNVRMQRELDFHLLVADASGNPVASVVVANLTSILTNELVDLPVEHDFQREIQLHEDVTAAIDDRDGSRAEALMRVHIEGVVSKVLANHPGAMRRPIRWM